MKNREIKFRAWIKGQNKMLEWGSGIISINHDLSIDSVPRSAGGYLSNQVILMQFTGLHDKEGKEIYEGDIIEAGGENGSIGDVQFSHGVFGIEWTTSKKHQSMVGSWGQLHNLRIMDDSHMNQTGYMKIVGNIYQHPELLTPIK